jgi:hypothetical protein
MIQYMNDNFDLNQSKSKQSHKQLIKIIQLVSQKLPLSLENIFALSLYIFTRWFFLSQKSVWKDMLVFGYFYLRGGLPKMDNRRKLTREEQHLTFITLCK